MTIVILSCLHQKRYRTVKKSVTQCWGKEGGLVLNKVSASERLGCQISALN